MWTSGRRRPDGGLPSVVGMDLPLLGALAGLALVDSTSIGTLVLPLVLLLAPRVHVGRYALYLATVAGFYFVVGLVLVFSAGALAEAAGGLMEVKAVRQAQLILGIGLLAYGVVGDKLLAWWHRRSGTPEGPGRAARWRDRLVGPDADPRVVVATGLAAGTLELAGMLPFLAGVGLITRADLSPVLTTGVVVGYVLVMVLPAVVLLGVRLALAAKVERLLGRLSAWLEKQASSATYWVAAVVGLLLIGDATSAL